MRIFIGIDLDDETSEEKPSMLVVSTVGTAVVVK